MSTSPFSDPSFPSKSRFAKFRAQFPKHAALNLDGSVSHSSNIQPDDDFEAMYDGLTEAEIRFYELLHGAGFNKGNSMSSTTETGQPAPSDEGNAVPEQPAISEADPASPVKLAIHPYLSGCLNMIVWGRDVEFDDLVTLFVQCALQNPKKSLKKPFPGLGAPVIHHYNYEHIPASLMEQLNAYAVSTGWTPAHLLNRMQHYSLLRYYAGKLVIPIGLSAD